MPTNRFRNYQALINLVPGTMPMSFGNAETDTPARSMTTNVNGQANTNNSTRTDGATNVNIWLPNHVMYVAPVETIDTVNVSTASFDAEQGMAGGAAITVVTKSGTNHFRGSAFEFFNNNDLNATTYNFNPCAFNCNSKSGKPNKLPLEANIFGGTVGGPIRRDKVFFFGSYDGFRRSHSEFRFFDVPDAMRARDFSGAPNSSGAQQIIYDPRPLTNGVGRVAFDGNRIPGNLIDQVALKVLQLYPEPNAQGTGLGGLTRNYQRREDRAFQRDNYDAKINYNRTSEHQLWFKSASWTRSSTTCPITLAPRRTRRRTQTAASPRSTRSRPARRGRSTPTTLFDTTFGFARQKQDVFGPDFNSGNFGLDVLGIPGTNDAGLGDQRYAGYPFQHRIQRRGQPRRLEPDFPRRAHVFGRIEPVEDEGASRSAHWLYRELPVLDHWQPESGNPRGNFNFEYNATTLSGGQVNNFYNTFAAFMMGLTRQSARAFRTS